MKKSTTTVLFIVGSAIVILGVVMAVIAVNKKKNVQAGAPKQGVPKDNPASVSQITEPYYDPIKKGWTFPPNWKDPLDR